MAGFSANKIKDICVFGGSSLEKEKKFLESANHLGWVLAKREIHLVYGEDSLGLMRSVSTIAFLGGNQVLGIILNALSKENIIGKNSRGRTKGPNNV
jgi:predicted Rossmann-fold nucleotide-binding protein